MPPEVKPLHLACLCLRATPHSKDHHLHFTDGKTEAQVSQTAKPTPSPPLQMAARFLRLSPERQVGVPGTSGSSGVSVADGKGSAVVDDGMKELNADTQLLYDLRSQPPTRTVISTRLNLKPQ